MPTARFMTDGGVLSAEIVLSERRDGSYEMRLWHEDLNKIIKSWLGHFRNADDDRYNLPNPPPANDGRSVQTLVVVAVPTGVNPCTVSLVVRQGQTELARDAQTVAPGSVDKLVQLWVDLELIGGA